MTESIYESDAVEFNSMDDVAAYIVALQEELEGCRRSRDRWKALAETLSAERRLTND